MFKGLEKKCLYQLNNLLLEFSYMLPRNFHMAAAQPLPKRRIRLTGMTELASNCGDMYVDLTLLGLNWALTLKWNVFPPNPVRQIAENVLHHKHPAWSRSAQVRNSG